MRSIRRRQFGKIVVGAAGAVLLPQREAHAGPLFWAAARWVGAAVLSWGFEKVLDAAFAEIDGFRIDRTAHGRPTVAGTPTAVRLGERVEAGRIDERMYPIDNCLFSAFRQHNVALADAFTHWGRPTTGWTTRQLGDGFLVGQWWAPYASDRRYVVTRTYNGGRSFHYMAFRERSGASQTAQEVVAGAAPTRPRMKLLVHDPHNFAHDPREDRPGG